jgi:hypothetical protein
MTDPELIQALDGIRSTMVSVSTGGARIDDVNPQFRQSYDLVAAELKRRGIPNNLPYSDLWDWHGRWSNGDMPNYRSRRAFVAEVFNPLVKRISTGFPVQFEPTGWERVDRTVSELRDRLAAATVEEQFQAVGLLCREALISVAQAVYVAGRHPSPDGVVPSSTDAKRQLEAYILIEFAGGTNEHARKFVRSALDLSVTLQHKRTATIRDAAMCVDATTAVINVIAVASGRRDP